MYKRNAQGWSKHLDFFIIDEIVLQISFILGCLIRHGIMPYKSQIYMNLSFILVLIDAIVLTMDLEAFSSFNSAVNSSILFKFLYSVNIPSFIISIVTGV